MFGFFILCLLQSFAFGQGDPNSSEWMTPVEPSAEAIATPSKESLKFPDGFHWCAATSAYQIEGGDVHSDWWDWEKVKGHIKNGDRTKVACDSWHRFLQDLESLLTLGTDTYRMSIEWARIQPDEPKSNKNPGWNKKAIHHYRKEVELLRSHGITPLITLHHFSFPKWVRAKGGWTWDGAPQAFADFADVVRTQIDPDADAFITINEPFVNVISGYLAGVVPPGLHTGLSGLIPPMEGLLKAHAEVAKRFHAVKSSTSPTGYIRVGMAHHLRVIVPPVHTWDFVNFIDGETLLTGILSDIWNWAIPDALETGTLKVKIFGLIDENREIPGLAGSQDFVGVNYYTRTVITYADLISDFTGGGQSSFANNSQMDPTHWEVYPQGMEQILKQVAKRYGKKPVWITENGVEDGAEGLNDAKRISFLKQHLESVLAGIKAGAQVEMYCHWSLMDNFEWISGYEPRFGLFETDYKTLERKPRQSASVYREIIQRNRLSN